MSYELLYRTAYKLTIRQFGERLYHDVEREIAQYLESTAEKTIVPAFINSSSESSSTADAGSAFLKTVKKVWDDFTTAINLILQVLYYLVSLQQKKQKKGEIKYRSFFFTFSNVTTE